MRFERALLRRCPRIGAFAPERSPAVLPVARPGLARLAWFMSMSKPDDHVSATYVKFAKAATASARANAPSLSPYFIYTFLPHQDIEEPDDDLVARGYSVSTHAPDACT